MNVAGRHRQNLRTPERVQELSVYRLCRKRLRTRLFRHDEGNLHICPCKATETAAMLEAAFSFTIFAMLTKLAMFCFSGCSSAETNQSVFRPDLDAFGCSNVERGDGTEASTKNSVQLFVLLCYQS